MAANSELPSESEDMEHVYFDEDPSDGARSTIADPANVTSEKIEESENNCETLTTNRKIKPPKPIMVREINDITEFTSQVERDYSPNFEVEISSRWVKVNTQTFAVKEKIVNFYKQVPILCNSRS